MSTTPETIKLMTGRSARRKLRPGQRRRRLLVNAFAYAVLAAVAFAFIYPFIFMVSTSFRETQSIFVKPTQVVPESPTLSNYRTLFDTLPVLRWTMNSLFVATVVAAVKVVLDSMAGFVFARLEFFGKNVIFAVLIATLMLPAAVMVIPRFLIVRELGLLRTYWSLILPPLSFPLGIFLMRQAMAAVPKDIEDAARIDGCSTFGVYWRVVLPLVKPSLAVVAIVTFMLQWVDLIWPLIAVGSGELSTVTVGITSLKSEATQDFGLLMAANTAAFFPVTLMFIFLQRFFIAGLTAGATD